MGREQDELPEASGPEAAFRRQDRPAGEPGGDGPLEVPPTTETLLERARAGDDEARNQLIARHLTALRRWGQGRLPHRARGAVDTDDLVQVALVKALSHLGTFEPRHPGAFLAYLRQIVLNEIRQEIRRVERRPSRDASPDGLVAREPSPLEQVIGKETMEAYESGLQQLDETPRVALILRLEFGFSHEQIATAIGSPSANAARMTVKRGLLKLAEVMERARRAQ